MANVAGTSSADTITEVFTSIGVVGIPGVDSDIIMQGMEMILSQVVQATTLSTVAQALIRPHIP
jgi:hypothetical protein